MAPRVDDSRRYDLYLCAASAGAIAPGASSSSAGRPSLDAGDLAGAVFDGIVKRANDSGRAPSVFYAPRCLQGRHDESVDATLQTRGGGVALFVIVKPFLDDQRCIAQLLCFLFVQENAPDEAKVDFRFVLVGVSAEEFLQHPSLQLHAHRLAEYVLHAITVGAIGEVAFRIIELAWGAWMSPSSPNVLGATVKDSLLDLLNRVFHGHDVSLAKLVFGIEDSKVTTLADVLNVALSTHMIGGGYDGCGLLDKLVTAGSGLTCAEKRAAVSAYKRKWSLAGACDWSSDARDTLKCISASPLTAPTAPASSVSPDQDVAQPPGFVQRNPSGVLLDYDSPTTEEGRLKRLLLAVSGHNLVAAVGASSGLAAAHGMGGVGKTCALRGLGLLPDVWRLFPGGIFFLELGQDASVSDVLRMLSKIMRARGNNEEAKEIGTCVSVKDAADIVVTALSNVNCLFLIDDVWSSTSHVGGHLKDLQHLVETNERSRMVFSTRDKKIADYASVHTVLFGTRDEATSRRMLLKYAGFTEEEADSMPVNAVESFQSALNECGGLPIALAATGRVVESESKRLGQGVPKFQAWNVYKKNADPYYALCAHAQHPGLSAALLQCVAEVDRRLRSDGQEHKLSAAEMFRALCVLQKRSWAPFSMLGALWSASTNCNVNRAAEAFEALSMLEIEVREVGGSLLNGIRLHDLVHDFCMQQAIKNGESKGQWGLSMLNGYLQHEQSAWAIPGWLRKLFALVTLLPKESARQPRPWWCVHNDGYIYSHVIRHLLDCDDVAEAMGLLLELRYILAQVKHNGLRFVMQDLERVMSYLRKVSAEQNDEARRSKVQALELLATAIGHSWSGVDGDARLLPHRLAFQLLARLNQFKAVNADVVRLLRDVGEYGPAPFLQPLSLALPVPNPGLRISLEMGCRVKAVAWVRGTDRVMIATEASKTPGVLDISTGRTVHELVGHEECVSCVAAVGSGSAAVAVSGGDDGTLRFWSAETGQESGDYIQATKGSVVALAASQGGTFIVSASSYREVRRWGADAKEEVGLLIASAPDSIGAVLSVAISSNGRRAAAGTSCGSIWLWHIEGVGAGADVTAVELGSCSTPASVIAITTDGETVVSGNGSTLRFWDVRQQCADGDPIEIGNDVSSLSISECGHIYCGLDSGDIHAYDVNSHRRVRLLRHAHPRDVCALDVSADGRRLASGGANGLVRHWDLAASSEWVGGGESSWGMGRCAGVLCIAASSDGRWVVTGHDKRNNFAVQFWDAATGEPESNALRGHDDDVLCIAVSPDSRRVVSGSWDATVRVWGVDSREEVLGPLHGHSDAVESVAISADGSRIVSASGDTTLRVWVMATGIDLFGPLYGHGGWVLSATVSLDGRWIASGDFYGDLRLWDMRNGTAAGGPLRGYPGPVGSVAVSADCQFVVSRVRGEEVRVWSIETRECVRIAKCGDPLYHSIGDASAATSMRPPPASSTLLSMSHTERSRYVYQGDAVHENIVAVFDLSVEPNKWHFDSDRQRLWVVFEGETLGTADFM